MPPTDPASFRQSNRRGLTLIELLVVLTVLIAVGGMITLTFSQPVSVTTADGESREAAEIVTHASMQKLRDALVGADTDATGYLQHNGNLPERIGYLARKPAALNPYDPVRQRGWRGPYLLDPGTRYGDFVEVGDGFTAAYGLADDPCFLDGWGKPIILQEPLTNEARLVSAGPDGFLQTDPTNAANPARGDDLVLFLRASDPLP